MSAPSSPGSATIVVRGPTARATSVREGVARDEQVGVERVEVGQRRTGTAQVGHVRRAHPHGVGVE